MHQTKLFFVAERVKLECCNICLNIYRIILTPSDINKNYPFFREFFSISIFIVLRFLPRDCDIILVKDIADNINKCICKMLGSNLFSYVQDCSQNFYTVRILKIF